MRELRRWFFIIQRLLTTEQKDKVTLNEVAMPYHNGVTKKYCSYEETLILDKKKED